MRIVVLEKHTMTPDNDLSWDAFSQLGELTLYDRTSPEQVAERAKDADILVINKTRLNAEMLAGLPRVKCVCILATGFDVVDIKAAGKLGIPVCNAPAYGVNAVAEHTFALLLELCRRTSLHDASIHRGEWQSCGDFCYWLTPQRDLAGMTLGVMGFGNVGRRTSELGKAFGMDVLVCTRNPSAQSPYRFTNDPDELFKQADAICLHCALTDSTRGLVNARRLALMKPEALLINTARGPLVDEEALALALKEGRLAGFAADVLSTEPPSPENPLLHAPNTLLTPHIAWATRNARQNILSITAGNIRAFLDKHPSHVVNSEWLSACKK
ncbi:MAG: D-2-hydroxyacid dehydrogenase [Desulfovibrionaceae bacterium]|nr:D-2-hydroxyacid dehydrogenase [Desulfovibrionaceae bacterium]